MLAFFIKWVCGHFWIGQQILKDRNKLVPIMQLTCTAITPVCPTYCTTTLKIDWLNYWEQPLTWYCLRNSLRPLQYSRKFVDEHFSLVSFCSTHVFESKRYTILEKNANVSVIYNFHLGQGAKHLTLHNKSTQKCKITLTVLWGL